MHCSESSGESRRVVPVGARTEERESAVEDQRTVPVGVAHVVVEVDGAGVQSVRVRSHIGYGAQVIVHLSRLKPELSFARFVQALKNVRIEERASMRLRVHVQ